MSIEILEPRIAPAAVISLTTVGTSLKVAGAVAGQPIGVTFTTDPTGGVDVESGSGVTFTLNGSVINATGPFGVHVPSAVGSITVIGGGGTSTGSNIDFEGGVYGGSLTVDLAGIGNTVNFHEQGSAGGVTVNAPTGGGTVVLFDNSTSTFVGGAVKLSLGIGSNVVAVTTPEFEAVGGFTFAGGPTKTGSPTTGANTLLVNQSGSQPLFEVGGGLAFNSKFAPGAISIQSSNWVIAGKLTATELSPANIGQTDSFEGGTVDIGGGLSWSSAGSAGFLLDGGQVNVGGKLALLGGSGNLTVEGVNLNLGGITASGGITPSGLGSGEFTLTSQGSPLHVSGSMSLSNFGAALISGFGVIGGKVAIANTPTVFINNSNNFNGVHLSIGGSLSITAPQHFTSAPQNQFEFGSLDVGGSVSVTGNVGGDLVIVTDSSIFGSAKFNLGAGSQTLVIQQAQNADQMLIAGTLAVDLGGTGNQFLVSDANSPTAFLVLGATTITAPSAATDTFTDPSFLFAQPIKIKT